MIRRRSAKQFERWLYAVRFWCWCAIWTPEHQKPLSFYLHRYDRRQENERNTGKAEV